MGVDTATNHLDFFILQSTRAAAIVVILIVPVANGATHAPLYKSVFKTKYMAILV
jgi:hypothetical protein